MSEAEAESDSQMPQPASNPGRRGRPPGRGRGRGGRGRGRGRGSAGLLSHRSGRGGKQASDQPKVAHPRGVRKSNRTGMRKTLEPSQTFKDLHSQATMHFLQLDYDKAEEAISAAILKNPEIFTAHSLLSEIHMARNDNQRALDALFYGAHTRPRDPEVWATVADWIMRRTGEERISILPDAIYCFNQILSLDTNNSKARLNRAELNTELGALNKAVFDYHHLLKKSPHDVAILRSLAEILQDLGRSHEAIDHYDDALKHYRSTEPKTLKSLDWSDANIYAELSLSSEQYRQGLTSVKKMARWLLGRGEDNYWDDIRDDDDREFDSEHTPRRVLVPEFSQGQGTHLDSEYGNGLPMELRIKMGLLRLNLGDEHFEEALVRPNSGPYFTWLILL